MICILNDVQRIRSLAKNTCLLDMCVGISFGSKAAHKECGIVIDEPIDFLIPLRHTSIENLVLQKSKTCYSLYLKSLSGKC